MARRGRGRPQGAGSTGRGRAFDIESQHGSISNVGGDQHVYHGDQAYQLEQFRRAGPLVKALAILGFGLCLAGLALFGYTLFTHNPSPGDPDFARAPAGIALAAGTFFAGFVLVALSSIAMALGGRRGD